MSVDTQNDTDRLAEVFRQLSGPERQLLVCALAGNHPPNLAPIRPRVLRGLAKADARLTRELRAEARAATVGQPWTDADGTHAHEWGPWQADPIGAVRVCACGAFEARHEG
jgi:hypothetical protein